MPESSLFGHLAAKFSAHPESLATKALNYILNRFSVVKQDLIRYIAQTDVVLASDLIFQTQMDGEGVALPHLVACCRCEQASLCADPTHDPLQETSHG